RSFETSENARSLDARLMRSSSTLAPQPAAAPAMPASTTSQRPAARREPWFIWVLILIAAASLVIRVRIGSLEYMDFDEWQQVFMASAPRWRDLAYELNAEAHPAAFYLLLKGLMLLGHGKLLYRCIALVPGAGSVIAIGMVAR